MAEQAEEEEDRSPGRGKRDKKNRAEPKESDEEDDSKEQKEKEELLSGWLRDLMEGFAEIYKVTIAAGHQCGDCVRKVSYPVKQRVIETYDEVNDMVNPPADVRTARGEFSAAPTFAHE
mmetsp:Transcript_136715/g.381000  ORF Transcript_136715/g.381000 Transcript_136715/m.381000 type:complete len:119 (-) Transcript_136715:159-515(-)